MYLNGLLKAKYMNKKNKIQEPLPIPKSTLIIFWGILFIFGISMILPLQVIAMFMLLFAFLVFEQGKA